MDLHNIEWVNSEGIWSKKVFLFTEQILVALTTMPHDVDS
jgi:hypothetical protein